MHTREIIQQEEYEPAVEECLKLQNQNGLGALLSLQEAMQMNCKIREMKISQVC